MSTEEEQIDIVYVDDEPRNLSLFEMSVPDHWRVTCFESAVDALKSIKSISPAVIVSDQRMPNMSGLEFLEVAADIVPDSVRFVVTGQTDEEIIIELVRRAKIFDYVTKPWNAENLMMRLQKGVEFNQAVRERNKLLKQLQEKNEQLFNKNQDLMTLTSELQSSKDKETQLRHQMEGLTHWQLAEALKRDELKFPFKKDIACITFDIIGSSKLADLYIEERPVRSKIMLLFKELVLGHGGLVESQGGDSCYAHIGAFDEVQHPCSALFHAAREFRVKLRNFSVMHGVEVECGVGLHYVKDAVIDQDVIKTSMADGQLRTKKDIHTQSREIDILHRIERLVHGLPGSNLILTKAFVDNLKQIETKLESLGPVSIRGQENAVELYLLKSDLVKDEDLAKLKAELQNHIKTAA